MKTLQQLEYNGITSLKIRLGEAVKGYYGFTGHCILSIPCPSVEDGVYRIDSFDEAWMYSVKNVTTGEVGWIRVEEKDLEETKKAWKDTKKVLVLKNHLL